MLRNALVLVLLLAALAASAAADQFPLYPESARSPSPGSVPGRANAICTVKASPAKVGGWYVERLRQMGWTILSSGERAAGAGKAFTVMARSADRSMSVVVTATPTATGARYMVGLAGKDVTDESIEGEAAELKPPQAGGAQRPAAGSHPGGAGSPGSVAPPGLPASADPAASGAWASLAEPFDRMVTALERFCAAPGTATARAAVTHALAYLAQADRVGAQANERVSKANDHFAAMSVFGGGVADSGIAMLATLIEDTLKTPARLPQLATRVKPIVEDLRNKVRKAILAPMDYISESARVAAAPAVEAPAHAPTPAEIEVFGADRPEPATSMTVTRAWTPRSQFWAANLKDTWVALRCWNAGCPEGCVRPKCSIVGGQHHHTNGKCLAFGTWEPHAGASDLHCLGIRRTREKELDLLSRKMTVFGLVALHVEVNDPEQLRQGGEIRVWVNDQLLGSVPLPALGKPARNANPWDYAEQWKARGFGSGATLTAVAEKQFRGIQAVYGDEAADAFRAAYRFEAPVTSASGGEIDGYTRFLHIGVPAMDARSDSLLIGVAGSDLFGLTQRIRAIAGKAHPALSSIHRIRLQATVGGVSCEPVDFELPGPFARIADSVGEWSGWPGGQPSGWEFGSELGPPPQPDAPAMLPVQDLRAMLLKANRRFAMMCVSAIVKTWKDKLQELATGCAVSAITGGVSDSAREAVGKCFKDDRGAVSLLNAYHRIGKIMDNAQNAAEEQAVDSLLDALQENLGKQVDAALGDELFAEAETFANRISVYGTPSYECLTYDAQARITKLRHQMWLAAAFSQREAWAWSGVDSVVENVFTLGGWVKGTTFSTYWTLPQKVFSGTGWAGLGISHLNQCRLVTEHLRRIEAILKDPANWRRA